MSPCRRTTLSNRCLECEHIFTPECPAEGAWHDHAWEDVKWLRNRVLLLKDILLKIKRAVRKDSFRLYVDALKIWIEKEGS